MRANLAITVRYVVLAAAPACLTAAAWGAATADSAVAAPADAASEEASAPAAKAFDPAALPEVGPAKAPLGYQYAELTPSQAGALRRGFKLPLDALAYAKSPAELSKAVVVAPLPDPNRPLLPVDPATESLANPFADTTTISFRKDPLKALGALLGASSSQPASATPASAAEADDPFGAASAPAAAPEAEVESNDDPFGAAADPFGGETESEAPAADDDDPFGAF